MKSRHRNHVTLLAAMSVASSAGAATTWRLTEFVDVPLQSVPAYSYVCSQYDSTVCANVADFYRFRQRNLQRMTVVVTFSERIGLRASMTTGAKAAKLTIGPRVVLGLIGSMPLSAGRSVSAEVFGSLGGSLRHKPCLDQYDREYFCGSLTAWSDFPNKQSPYRESGIKLIYRY